MKVRVTGIVIYKGKILLVEQNVDGRRKWSLPGGGLEKGESLEEGLVREIFEETGVEVKIEKLLYICDYIRENSHVIHITFLTRTTKAEIGKTQPGLDENAIKSVAYVSIDKLVDYGFSGQFMRLVQEGFPNAGSYMGDKSNIGLA